MEPSRDEILFATLESLRPAPSPAFAAELDARVATGFPRESAPAASGASRLAAWARGLRPRRIVLAGGATALAAIGVAAVLVASPSTRVNIDTSGGGNIEAGPVVSGSESSAGAPRHLDRTPKQIEEAFGAAGSGKPTADSDSSSSNGAGVEYEASAPTAASAGAAAGTAEMGSAEAGINDQYAPSSGPYASQAHHRDVEYAAEMVLGTEPEEVGDAAGKVFDAVHRYGGIVLDSSVSGGSASDAGAEFELLIPSAKLGDALAAFSRIADVRSRHETSNDITAPTVTTAELLQDSHARIESLLNELAETETEAEREAVEAKLRSERRHAAVLKSSLTNLQRRANFSHVSLRIESGAADSSSGAGGWDVGDAFHDAGQILAAAAGVAIVGLAILGPIALIALLVWLGNRAWLRQRRERALG
ncbi:MAG TPA: DUF4349 domain-containing protein [Solirubrobacterales bacterium]|nr:DUF4349 domain-containing protein [Solirubrobacterales bacterium]